MQFIENTLSAAFWLSTACTAIGLYRPWIVLWWMDTMNRKMALKIYGSAAILSFLTLKLIDLAGSD